MIFLQSITFKNLTLITNNFESFMKSIKIGKSILVSDDLLPANKDIIFLSFEIKFDKSVFDLILFSSNGCPTNVFLMFSLFLDNESRLISFIAYTLLVSISIPL